MKITILKTCTYIQALEKQLVFQTGISSFPREGEKKKFE
jgi:predicted small secreted protein